MATSSGGVADLEQVNVVKVTSTDRVIGSGSYGKVIEVYVHGTLCAAKELHSNFVDNVSPQEFVKTKKAFVNECVHASRILHPNVVQVLGIHYPTPEAKLPWLVMELMECSLQEFLRRNLERDNCKLPLYTKLSILVDISQGLEFLHGQNVIHRDLSSNNVLLTKHNVAKIADLGVAKVIEQNLKKTYTQIPGTPHFMPPEALSVKPRYGKPVDVFSVGCVALHTMSHQWPIPKDQVQLDSSYTMKPITEVDRRAEYLSWCNPDALKKLVERCLHNNPNYRPTISEVSAELKNLRASVENQVPLAKANAVELLNAVQQGEVRIQTLNKEIGAQVGNTERKVLELEKQFVQLQQLYCSQWKDNTSEQQSAVEQRSHQNIHEKIVVVSSIIEKWKQEIAALIQSDQLQGLLAQEHTLRREDQKQGTDKEVRVVHRDRRMGSLFYVSVVVLLIAVLFGVYQQCKSQPPTNACEQQQDDLVQQLKNENQALLLAQQKLADEITHLKSRSKELGDEVTELKTMNEQLSEENEQLKSTNKQLEDENRQLKSINKQLADENEQLKSTNKELEDENKQLKSIKEQLTNENGQLKSTNKQLDDENKQLKLVNKQTTAENEQLKLTNKQLDDKLQNLPPPHHPPPHPHHPPPHPHHPHHHHHLHHRGKHGKRPCHRH